MAEIRVDALIQRAQSTEIQVDQDGQVVSDGLPTISAPEAQKIVEALYRGDGFSPDDAAAVRKLLAAPGAFSSEQARAALAPLAAPSQSGAPGSALSTADRASRAFEPALFPGLGLHVEDPVETAERGAKAITGAERVLRSENATADDKAEAWLVIARVTSTASIMGVSMEAHGLSPADLASKGANALRAYAEIRGADGLSESEAQEIINMVGRDQLIDPAELEMLQQILSGAQFEVKGSAGRRELEGMVKRNATDPNEILRLGNVLHMLNGDIAWDWFGKEEITPQYTKATTELIALINGGSSHELRMRALDEYDTLLCLILRRDTVMENLELKREDVAQQRVDGLNLLLEHAPPAHENRAIWFNTLATLHDEAGRSADATRVLGEAETWIDTNPTVLHYFDLMQLWEKREGALEAHQRIGDKLDRFMARNQDKFSRREWLNVVIFYKERFGGGTCDVARAQSTLYHFNKLPEAARGGRTVSLDEL
ncbi:MAG: hypothetical protein V3T05_02385, partial [Myxococcota bacterium]